MEGPEKRARVGGERGKVAVAKYYYQNRIVPQVKGYTSVLIHSSDKGIGGPLSPFHLKNEKGQLMENVWQFSKLYERVEAQNGKDWSHPAEVHVDEKGGEPNEAYARWREKGMNHNRAVRYPNGYKGRTKCICSISEDGKQRLNYIQARKAIYCDFYVKHGLKHPSFLALKERLEKGENLLIVEVDGPDYNLTYEPYNRISKESPGLEMDEATVKMLLHDTRKPFGHGYVIAALLLGGEKWLK
jgi:hypothetical protein